MGRTELVQHGCVWRYFNCFVNNTHTNGADASAAVAVAAGLASGVVVSEGAAAVRQEDSADVQMGGEDDSTDKNVKPAKPAKTSKKNGKDN